MPVPDLILVELRQMVIGGGVGAGRDRVNALGVKRVDDHSVPLGIVGQFFEDPGPLHEPVRNEDDAPLSGQIAHPLHHSPDTVHLHKLYPLPEGWAVASTSPIQWHATKGSERFELNLRHGLPQLLAVVRKVERGPAGRREDGGTLAGEQLIDVLHRAIAHPDQIFEPSEGHVVENPDAGLIQRPPAQLTQSQTDEMIGHFVGENSFFIGVVDVFGLKDRKPELCGQSFDRRFGH